MVGTIRPVVHRDRLLFRWNIAVGLHIFGSLIASVAVGLVFGVLGYWLLPPGEDLSKILLGGLGVLSTMYAFDEANLLRLPYPQREGQVPATWRLIFHPYVTAFLYGMGLGTGISTRIVTATLYVVLAGIFFSASPLLAMATFGLFGLGRGFSMFVIGWYINNSPEEGLGTILHWLDNQEERVHEAAGLILALLGGYWLSSLMLLWI